MKVYRLSITLIIFSVFIFSLMIRPANGQSDDYELLPCNNEESGEQSSEEDNQVKQNNRAGKRNVFRLTFSVPHDDSGTEISERNVSFLVELSDPERVITRQDSIQQQPVRLSACGRRIITDPANQPCCSHDIIQETPPQPVSTTVVTSDPTSAVQTYTGYTLEETSESEHQPAPIRMSRESIEIFIMVARSLREDVHRLIDQRSRFQDLSQFILSCGNCQKGHCCCVGSSNLLGLAGAAIAFAELRKHTISTVAKALTLSSSTLFCCLLGCSLAMYYQKRFILEPQKVVISIKHEQLLPGELPENSIRKNVQEILRRLISSFHRIGSWPALISLSSTTHDNGSVMTYLTIEIRTPVNPHESQDEFLEYYGLSDIRRNPDIRIGPDFNYDLGRFNFALKK